MIPLIHDIKINVLERMNNFDINVLKNHNFQMHLYTNKELCELTFKIFDSDIIYKNETNFTGQQLKEFIQTLCLKYNVIPYHNWTHAFSVFQVYIIINIFFIYQFINIKQMFYCIYQQSNQIKEYIKPFEYFSAQITCLAHDLNHKGLNNIYKINKKSQGSLNYYENAVLENMHSSQLFTLLQTSSTINFQNIFKNNVKKQKKIKEIISYIKNKYIQQIQDQISQFKKIFISSILATDMTQHQKIHRKFEKRVESSLKIQLQENQLTEFDNFKAFKKDNFDDRRFIINVIIHACDIGNPCLQFNNYMNWSYLITQEFQDQIEKEKLNNLPLTTFLIYKDKVSFYRGQVFFCQNIVFPLWKQIGILFPELLLYSNQIQKNVQELEQRIQKIQ
ncbi:hypothetical protein IMG5_060520 [Ichthyophthirius multifiliis]|uniref:PDEase domain-containing protein n=1 Tax=Ichthyophthirius multifiliis TaxID=5932 RepID=G0QNP0_ICHMU|nr:hypothetical protein IMG5_060520 [Ichthyophthirius multifiliis]EGR33159.1 hypothetical protein IMG5_060520 [Ichthyophthirius multifiliis]|eukprot:XP_004037145.1 hypothetical protein IMG5_060520 [Ichthyophthirius multifiliis]